MTSTQEIKTDLVELGKVSETGMPPAPHPEIREMAKDRAPHNPHQQLITVDDQALPATELVAAARSMPAVLAAVGTIAKRFEDFVQNIASLNQAIGQFNHEVMTPFREELKYLRYTTGDRLNHASSDLEKYVAQLDKVMWAALRAQGMTDAQIRDFRTETGMQPEAPRGYELEQHMRKVQAMEETIAVLREQNQRLIARMTGHLFSRVGDRLVQDWTYVAGCACEVCVDHAKAVNQATEETNR